MHLSLRAQALTGALVGQISCGGIVGGALTPSGDPVGESRACGRTGVGTGEKRPSSWVRGAPATESGQPAGLEHACYIHLEMLGRPGKSRSRAQTAHWTGAGAGGWWWQLAATTAS